MSVEDHEDTVPFICGVEAPLELQYNWQSNQPLSTIIVQTMIEAAGIDATDIPGSFYETVDPDALEDLFQPQLDGTPRKNGKLSFSFAGHYVTVYSDGQAIIESELGRLKRTGGNILLTGNVPENVLNQISVRLLGDPALDHTLLLAQYGRTTEAAHTRLSSAEATPNHTHVLTHKAATRSTALAQESQSNLNADSPVPETLDEFRTAIREKVFDLQQQKQLQNGFDPAELRFCFDSLRLLTEENSTETVDQFIATVTEAIENVDGLGHYILPKRFDSPSVQAVRSTFDVVIELTIDTEGPKQRWHLSDTDYTTTWFPV